MDILCAVNSMIYCKQEVDDSESEYSTGMKNDSDDRVAFDLFMVH